MKSKTIIRILLLAFVVASAAALFSKELRRHPEERPAAAEPASVPGASAGPTAETPLPGPAHQVVAYYFHGRYRCPSCLKIEAWTQAAVQSGFGEELKNGRLVWQAVNVEEPGNRHFAQDYQLYTKSVIISDRRQGQEARWKNLDQVWTLLGDQAAFTQYVQDEVRAYLQEER